MANLRNFIVFGKFFAIIFFDIVGPHAKGAKVVGAQGDLGMERRLPAAAPWQLFRDALLAALDVELAGSGVSDAAAEDVVEGSFGHFCIFNFIYF